MAAGGSQIVKSRNGGAAARSCPPARQVGVFMEATAGWAVLIARSEPGPDQGLVSGSRPLSLSESMVALGCSPLATSHGIPSCTAPRHRGEGATGAAGPGLVLSLGAKLDSRQAV